MTQFSQFSVFQDFLNVHLICKFQKDPIKTECCYADNKVKTYFFSNQGDLIPRLMIRSGQVLKPFEILYMSALSISFRKIQSKLNVYADDIVKQRLFQQTKGRNCKTNDPIWPVFELIRDLIHVHYICKIQEELTKNQRVTQTTSLTEAFFRNLGDSTKIKYPI